MGIPGPLGLAGGVAVPRLCTVCTHPARREIDQALATGTGSNRFIAAHYSLAVASVRRHAGAHLPATLSRAAEAAEVARADDLLGQVQDLQRRALAVLGKAEEAGDLRTALGAIREARGNLELLAKLLGELDDSPTVNLTGAPQWLEVRTLILRALEPHPDARLAVAAALEARGVGH